MKQKSIINTQKIIKTTKIKRKLSRELGNLNEAVKYRGTILGYYSDEYGFYGTVNQCRVSSVLIEMEFTDGNGNSYKCELVRGASITANNFIGKWKCGTDTNEISGRLMPDFNDWFFAGKFIEEVPYKIYVELFK